MHKVKGRAELELVRSILQGRSEESGGIPEIPRIGSEMLVAASGAVES